MNTDFIVWDEPIREKQYHKNITSQGDTRYYNDSCKSIKKYAKEQNTKYNPLTNQILYGINSAMKVSGVSDGTCNQINPYIYEPENICGAGTAGGNRCEPDMLNENPFGQYMLELDEKPVEQNNYEYLNSNLNNYDLENFESNCNMCDSCNVTEFIITLLLVILITGIFYTKSLNIKI